MPRRTASAASHPLQVLGPALTGVWDNVAAASPDATFFHTRLWAEVIVAADPGLRIAGLAFSLHDGATAILPMLERRSLGGLFRGFDSATPGVFGGPIADRSLTDTEVEAILRSVPLASRSRYTVNGNPYASWRLPASLAPHDDFTQAIDLTSGIEAVEQAYRRSANNNSDKARRRGLAVALAGSETDYRAYYACYLETLARWGRRALYRVPWQVFANLRERAGPAHRLWLVKSDGLVVGGVAVLHHNAGAFAWHSAVRNAFRNSGVDTFAERAAIRDACEQGLAWYDLGSSTGNEGVVAYKAAFNAQRLPFQRLLLHESPAYRAAARLRALSMPAAAIVTAAVTAARRRHQKEPSPHSEGPDRQRTSTR